MVVLDLSFCIVLFVHSMLGGRRRAADILIQIWCCVVAHLLTSMLSWSEPKAVGSKAIGISVILDAPQVGVGGDVVDGLDRREEGVWVEAVVQVALAEFGREYSVWANLERGVALALLRKYKKFDSESALLRRTSTLTLS